MSLSEFLFGKLYSRAQKILSTRKDAKSQTVFLKHLRPRLNVLASLLFEKNIQIEDCDDIGGLKGHIFYLPASCSFFESQEANFLYYLHRLCKYSPQQLPGLENVLDPLMTEWKKHQHTQEEINWFDGPPPADSEYIEAQSLDSALIKKTSIQKQFEAQTYHQHKTLRFDEKEDNPLTSIFEKTKTAEEYSVGQKQLDGSDELDSQREALSELKFGYLIRSKETAETSVEADFIATRKEQNLKIPKTQKTFYPEWNWEKACYQSDWCSLYESKPEPLEKISPPKYREARRSFAYLLNDYKVQKYKKYGEDIDIDAVLRWYNSPYKDSDISPPIYSHKIKKERDFCMIVLLDFSQSMESYVRNIKVGDFFKSIVESLMDPLDFLGIPLALHVFYSNTRNENHYLRVKDFEDAWSERYSVFSSIQASGYSRIGPAIRHGTEILSQRNEKHKILLLFSDAKPTDYDAYEGDYGIHDVKKAWNEAFAKNLKTHAFVFSKRVDASHKFMFGSSKFKYLNEKDSSIDVFRIISNLL